MVSINKTREPKRSRLLLDAETSVLFLVDIQERFRPAISGMEEVIRNASVLIQAANRLEVPVLFSEQYPKALGSTVEEIARHRRQWHGVFAKMCFSAGWPSEIVEHIGNLGRKQVVLAGVEAHVCVLQTALDLQASLNVVPYVVADATASRKETDYHRALSRAEKGGAEVITTEMAVFEWLREAGTAEFKELQALVK